jgi:hypothetical protein
MIYVLMAVFLGPLVVFMVAEGIRRSREERVEATEIVRRRVPKTRIATRARDSQKRDQLANYSSFVTARVMNTKQLLEERLNTPRRKYRKFTDDDAWEVGVAFETDVGRWFEKYGFQVDYRGIRLKMEDRGIDLVCTKEMVTVFVQCKCWASDRCFDVDEVRKFQSAIDRFCNSDSIDTRSVRKMLVITSVATEDAQRCARDAEIRLVDRFFLKSDGTKANWDA